MMKKILALVLALSVSALTTFASASSADESNAAAAVQADQKGQRHGRHGSRQEVAEPENAIGKDAAKAKALADAGVTEEQAGKVKARVTQLEDGTIVYKVTFIYDGQRYAYQINATTGAVVDKSIETASDRAASSDRGIEDGARMETSAAEATSASA